MNIKFLGQFVLLWKVPLNLNQIKPVVMKAIILFHTCRHTNSMAIFNLFNYYIHFYYPHKEKDIFHTLNIVCTDLKAFCLQANQSLP